MMFLEHITKEGERWDQLAYRYYHDPLGYPRIIAANPHVAITPVLSSGILLLIPVIEADDNTLLEDTPPWLR
ncbi:membrane protein [Serratia sp. Ag1]|nr:membrane protein [Serratia sp. Ag2]KFK92924.1 membrane protein [Serratia sp. Ag1]